MKTAKCPVCGKEHQVLETALTRIYVIKCSLITDLIYLDNVVVKKSVRNVIKRELGL